MKKNNLSTFLSSSGGKRFFNMAYSWGASVVIIGALFKILHLPYANEMLMVGMIVEAGVFFLSGFDSSMYDEQEEVQVSNTAGVTNVGSSDSKFLSPEYSEKMSAAAQSMEDFAKTMTSLNETSVSLLGSYKQISDSSVGVTANSIGFADNIKGLNDNVSQLNGIYESQLQSISDQIATVKYINESLERIKGLYDGTISDSTVFKSETEKMTKQIEALNNVYARLLQAMTANNPNNVN